MIERLTNLPEYVLGFSAIGEVTEADYESVLIPAIEEKLTNNRKVRLLYVLGKDFKGYTGAAAWEDTKIGLKHLTRFDRVAKQIDPYIDAHEGLKGVMIVAAQFPGWDDLSAFLAHCRFVQAHRTKIRRLAIVTDDRLLSAVPTIASHLRVIEAKSFPADRETEALAWIIQQQ